ncbi:MAG: DUF1624 domain-containing protein [Thermoplasmata archaeon]|nr:DUF1624 domain-containing protein [Thermoplasmata archaeon]
MQKNQSPRFWEIDLLRAVAIIMMIIFHFLYDLDYFGDYDFNLDAGLWWVFRRSVAIIFLTLVGISLTLTFSRAETNGLPAREINQKTIKRGLMIFAWGLIITLITWVFLREVVIVFGVLHLIGVSIILALAFLKLRHWNLVIGAGIIIAGIFLRFYYFGFPWLVWLGFRPYEYNYIDYFPLLPWFGVVLIGIVIGHTLYPKYKRKFNLPDLSENTVMKPLYFIGQHSLFIYLVHQPVLITLLYALGFVNL